MKKTFTIILTLMLAIAIAVSTSGCSIIAGELGKEEEKRLILSLLNEKYGEEFIVHSIESQGSGGNGVPNLKALFDFSGRYTRYNTICSPKSNEEILFEAYEREKGTVLYDDYPHAVVKHLIKEEVEKVISKYSDNFAVYVYMSKPKHMPNDTKTYEYLESVVPFTKASDITIKSYNEKYLQTYLASIDIVLCDEKYKSIEATQKILDDNFKYSLYEMRTVFYFYFTNENKVNKIRDILNNSGITPDSQYSSEKYDIDCELVFRHNQDTNYTFKYSDKLSEFD
jgi:S-adenosylmethionine/arginine decarboxylase-like enzyme